MWGEIALVEREEGSGGDPYLGALDAHSVCHDVHLNQPERAQECAQR